MAETISITINEQWFEVTLEVGGLFVNHDYRLVRHGDNIPSEVVRQWAAGNTSDIFTDITPQVGVNQWYTLHAGGNLTPLVTSATFRINYDPVLRADTPLWDTTQGSWPVLRTVNGPWLAPLRLPVADYDAEWGYRASVYQIVGSEYPVVASDVAVMKQGDLVFLTANNTERRKFVEYIRHHRVVHLASPCVDGLQHLFFRVLAVSEKVPVKSRPLLREWQVKFQQVPRPAWYGIADWAGRRTWGDVYVGSQSWADATAVFGATWLDWRGEPGNIPLGRADAGVTVGGEGSW